MPPEIVLSTNIVASVRQLDGTVDPDQMAFTVRNSGPGVLRYNIRAVETDGRTPSSPVSITPAAGSSTGDPVEHTITLRPDRIEPPNEEDTVAVAYVIVEDAGDRVPAQAIFVVVSKNLVDLAETRLVPERALPVTAAFGSSVALANDYAVVTAAGRIDRSAYVFRRRGSGWRQQDRIRPSAESDGFGRAAALGGDRFATAGDDFTYIHRLVDGTVRLETRLDCQSVLRRCTDVDLNGTLLAFATDNLDASRGIVGSVPIYRRSGGSWAREYTVLPPPRSVGANFLGSVSLDGDRLVVGIPFFEQDVEEVPAAA